MSEASFQMGGTEFPRDAKLVHPAAKKCWRQAGQSQHPKTTWLLASHLPAFECQRNISLTRQIFKLG